jgi:hypothetical protein
MAHISAAVGQAGDDLLLVCECSRPDCSERIPLDRPEYEAVRAVPTHFVVLAGHTEAGIDNVVTSRDGYAIVAVIPSLAQAARDTDPRSGKRTASW